MVYGDGGVFVVDICDLVDDFEEVGGVVVEGDEFFWVEGGGVCGGGYEEVGLL